MDLEQRLQGPKLRLEQISKIVPDLLGIFLQMLHLPFEWLGAKPNFLVYFETSLFGLSLLEYAFQTMWAPAFPLYEAPVT